MSAPPRSSSLDVRPRAWSAAIAISLAFATGAAAQPSFESLHSFAGGGPAGPETPLVQGADGHLYGTSLRGGTSDAGTIFRMTLAGAITVVHSFRLGSPSNGAHPYAGLTLASDGNFYGTTHHGGAGCDGADCGTIYRMTPSGTVTVIYAFVSADPGSLPLDELVEGADGALYGTSSGFSGSIFRITKAGAYSVVHVFGSTAADPRIPRGRLALAPDGNLYGTTGGGGPSNLGTVFRVTGGSAFEVVHAFTGGAAGAIPAGLVVGPDGHLYGATTGGGAANGGMIFKVTVGGVFTPLATLPAGARPQAAPTPAGGALYVTASQLGSGNGAVLRVSPAGAVTTVATLPAHARLPMASLVLATDGNLYSTTAFGVPGSGTVFRVNAAGALQIFTMVDGGLPSSGAGLLQGTDGQLYGTTEFGGHGGAGAVFRAALDGSVVLASSFTGGPGPAYSHASLVQGGDGNYYGTTWTGGTSRAGTIFRTTPAGVTSVVHSFAVAPTSGAGPFGHLLMATDGNYYGTTFAGGSADLGTIFRMSAGGGVTTLYSFPGGTVGRHPQGGLVEGPDGHLYGVLVFSGPADSGGLFRITKAGTFSMVHTFGGGPLGGLGPWIGNSLIVGSDGFLYGATTRGGANNRGTVYRSTLDGAVTVLHSFGAGPSGTSLYPDSTLVEGSDGALYGTASGSEMLQLPPTIYRVRKDGAFELLHTFDGYGPSTHERPTAEGLVQATDGNFYGVTAAGGANGLGMLYRINVQIVPGVRRHPGSVALSEGQVATLSVIAVGTGPLSFQWYAGTSGDVSNPVTGATASSLAAIVTADARRYWVRVTNAFGSVDSRDAAVTPVIVQPPSDLAVAAIVGNAVTFTWVPPAAGLPPGAYALEGGASPGQVLASLPIAPGATVTLTVPTGVYFVRLHTLAGVLRSAASNEVRVVVNVPMAPSPPANLLGLVNGAAVHLSWTPTLEGGAPTGQVLEVSGPVNVSLPLTTVDSFSYPSVPPGTYTFAVRATNLVGPSALSNPVTLTFPGACSGAPQSPTAFSATSAGGRVSLSWRPPGDGAAVTGYVLSVSGAFSGQIPVASRALAANVAPGTYVVGVAAANPCGVGPATPLQTLVIP